MEDKWVVKYIKSQMELEKRRNRWVIENLRQLMCSKRRKICEFLNIIEVIMKILLLQ